MIDHKVDCPEVDAAIAELTRASASAAPLMRRVANVMLDAVEENFAQEGRPGWAGIKRKGKILQSTGRLADSIVTAHDDTTAAVGTNVVYARIHNNGGTTKAHMIRPKNKKALSFNGRVVKSVRHPGSKIPARPFLKLTPDDEREIVDTAEDYLRALGLR